MQCMWRGRSCRTCARAGRGRSAWSARARLRSRSQVRAPASESHTHSRTRQAAGRTPRRRRRSPVRCTVPAWISAARLTFFFCSPDAGAGGGGRAVQYTRDVRRAGGVPHGRLRGRYPLARFFYFFLIFFYFYFYFYFFSFIFLGSDHGRDAHPRV